MHKLTFRSATTLAAMVLLALTAAPAQAYMGAGAGLSAIGSILSFLGVMLLMVLGFVWYPVKRMIRKARAKGAAEQSASGE